MFGVPRTSDPNGLLTSRLLDQDDFYDVFIHDLRRSRSEVIIESPFMSLKRINQLTPSFQMLVRHRVHIIINTKHSTEQEPTYQQQFEACIERLLDMGADVLFTGGHHRKLAILDGNILYEGSLNILSQNSSCEIMRRIESEQLAQQMVEFLKIDKFVR